MKRAPKKAERPEGSAAGAAKVATSWLFFWLVFGITVFKDIVDPALAVLVAVTTATVIGIPIAIFCAIIGFIMTLTVSIIVMTYHLYTRKALGVKFIITSIGMFLGAFPPLSILPESVITFVVAHFIGEIASTARKAVGKAARLAGKAVS